MMTPNQPPLYTSLTIDSCRPSLWQGCEAVELRAEGCKLSEQEVEELVRRVADGGLRAVMFTLHPTPAEEPWAEGLIAAAIRGGARAIDVEQGSDEVFLAHISRLCKQTDTQLIISHHDHLSTPSTESLVATAERAFTLGADVAKVVTTAHTSEEVSRLVALYNAPSLASCRNRLVAFAMGLDVAYSRPLSLILGAPHSYVRHPLSAPTAVGQPTAEEMDRLLFATHTPLPHLTMPARADMLPCSKSEAQRAIVLAWLSGGTMRLGGLTPSGDVRSAIALVEQLGCQTEQLDRWLTIHSPGPKHTIKLIEEKQLTTIDVGESALLARLSLALFSTLSNHPLTICGRGSLEGRNLSATLENLRRLGVAVECLGEPDHLPVKICGTKQCNSIEIDGSDSSQLASGLMMALPLGGVESLKIGNSTSRPYLHLTAQMMAHFGVEVEQSKHNNTLYFRAKDKQYNSPYELHITPDWSSAAYFVAAFAVVQSGVYGQEMVRPKGYRIANISLGSHQADERIVEILTAAGANISLTNNELSIMPSDTLTPLNCDASDCPDLLPTLAMVALFAHGKSRIGGLGRLKYKESNRAEALLTQLSAMGANIQIEGDEMVIRGGQKLSLPHIGLRPVTLRSHNDHRIAIVLILTALLAAQESIRIDNVACIDKSFPEFIKIFNNSTTFH